MTREWKPGDVAMRVGGDDRHVAVRVPRCTSPTSRVAGVPHWHFASASPGLPGQCGSDNIATYRPLVVIDPEDREQVERLYVGYVKASGVTRYDYRVEQMQAALREFANPKPPKPDEPQGLGAVVEDADGNLYVRTEPDGGIAKWVRSLAPEATDPRYVWSAIDAVRILSAGVES